MHLLRDTKLQIAPFVWRLRPPRPSLTLVVKATYRIPETGGLCTLLEDQPPCEGERFHDDDPTASLRFDTDLAVFKPRGEWVLAGTCHAPAGRPTPTVLVRIAVGSREKSIAVIGDRIWKPALLGEAKSEPVKLRSLPLRPERAFGGPDVEANPLGMGSRVGATTKQKISVPNLELPHRLIDAPSDRPPPAMTTPRGAAWKERIALAGTYDASWRKKRWPWFPEDFDVGYFNSAPRDQQIEGYWRGDEAIVLTGLHPTRTTIQARLPGQKARAFLLEHDCPVDEARQAGTLREVALSLDTIAIDADALVVSCLWRGVTEVASASLDEIEAVLVADEPIESRTQIASFAARLPAVARTQGLTLCGEPMPSPALSTAPAALSKGSGATAPRGPAALRREVRERRLAGVAPVAAVVPFLESIARPAASGPRPVDPERAARARVLVTEHLAAHRSLSGLDLSGADLSGLDLRFADLSKCVLADANLRGAHLYRTRLSEASLLRADLGEVSAPRCDLTRACLDGALLGKADLRYACLLSASFEGAFLDGAALEGVMADDASFHRASLCDASFVDAHLRRADLSAARCDRTDFTAALMTDLLLSDATGEDTRFERADLSGVRAAGETTLRKARLRRVTARRSCWTGARLEEADFSGALLGRAELANVHAPSARFDCADVQDTRFGGAVLVGSSWLRANARHAIFEGADLSHTDVRGACFFEAELYEARTEGMRSETANFQRTKLERR